jgi:hypothetical protein
MLPAYLRLGPEQTAFALPPGRCGPTWPTRRHRHELQRVKARVRGAFHAQVRGAFFGSAQRAACRAARGLLCANKGGCTRQERDRPVSGQYHPGQTPLWRGGACVNRARSSPTSGNFPSPDNLPWPLQSVASNRATVRHRAARRGGRGTNASPGRSQRRFGGGACGAPA